jgi:hypothetical protein
MRLVGAMLTVAFCCSLFGCSGSGTDDSDAKVKAILGNKPGGGVDMRGVGGQHPKGAKQPANHAQPGGTGAPPGGASPPPGP